MEKNIEGNYALIVTDGDLAPLIDEASSYTTYMGYAVLGTNVATASWKIKRVTTSCTIPATYPTVAIGSVGSGTNTIVEYADGDYNYDNIWANRASLTYSR